MHHMYGSMRMHPCMPPRAHRAKMRACMRTGDDPRARREIFAKEMVTEGKFGADWSALQNADPDDSDRLFGIV